jgi:hypothetical protein
LSSYFLFIIDNFYQLIYKCSNKIRMDFFPIQTRSSCPSLQTMSRKRMKYFVSLLVLSAFLMGIFAFAGSLNAFDPLSQPLCGKTSTGPGFKKPCDMDHCESNLPKCSLCSSPGSTGPYLGQKIVEYPPPRNPSFVLVCLNTLSDQGFIKSIFRPPTSIL